MLAGCALMRSARQNIARDLPTAFEHDPASGASRQGIVEGRRRHQDDIRSVALLDRGAAVAA